MIYFQNSYLWLFHHVVTILFVPVIYKSSLFEHLSTFLLIMLRVMMYKTVYFFLKGMGDYIPC